MTSAKRPAMADPDASDFSQHALDGDRDRRGETQTQTTRRRGVYWRGARYRRAASP